MLSYFHFALSPISTKLIITHPRAARYQLARSPRIHPPTSFVPLTVPTILHPAGPSGLTWKVRCSPRDLAEIGRSKKSPARRGEQPPSGLNLEFGSLVGSSARRLAHETQSFRVTVQ